MRYRRFRRRMAKGKKKGIRTYENFYVHQPYVLYGPNSANNNPMSLFANV